jgi:hypothetical protein
VVPGEDETGRFHLAEFHYFGEMASAASLNQPNIFHQQ